MKTIIKILMVVIAFLLTIQDGFSQGGVVSAPVLEGIQLQQSGLLGTMNGTMVAIENASKKIEKIKEGVQWVKDMESIMEFVMLMESITCMVKDLNINMRLCQKFGLFDPRSSCWNNFKYTINMTKVRKAVDLINVVLSSGFSMDREGRVATYNEAFKNYEQGQEELYQLNKSLEGQLTRYEMGSKVKESYKKDPAKMTEKYLSY